jgi:hypothetical protein
LNTSLFFRLAFLRFRQAPARLAVVTFLWLIFTALSLALLSVLPLASVWISFAFGPFWTGYIYYLVRWVEGDEPHWNALLSGWRRFLFPSAMAHLILSFIAGAFAYVAISFLTLTGMVRLFPWGIHLFPIIQIFSFIFVWSTFFLAFPMIADGERFFAVALQKSASIVWRRLADYLGFITVCFLILLAGLLTVFGVLFALPVIGLAIVQAYRYERDSLP